MDGAEANIALEREIRALSRKRLDARLMDAARDAGAKVLQPVRCESVSSERVQLRELGSNRIQTCNPATIFVADGKAHGGSPLDLIVVGRKA